MTKEYDRAMKLKEQSEKLFRIKCDENDYTYMYIDQEKMTYSSKIWKDMSKRPDYILSLPHIGSIFVDVKAYTEHLFYKDSLEHMKKGVPKAFRIEVEEVMKYLTLQDETALKVWLAIMPVQEDTVTNDIHFLPIDRVTKFMAERHYTKPEWNYVQVPIPCSTDCSKLAHNKCGKCTWDYCEQLDELLRLDDEIHFKKYGKPQ